MTLTLDIIPNMRERKSRNWYGAFPPNRGSQQCNVTQITRTDLSNIHNVHGEEAFPECNTEIYMPDGYLPDSSHIN